MALTHPYCTVEEVQGQLGDSAGKMSLPLLEKAINATSRAIDKYCGRRFWQDATVQARVYLPGDPCTVAVDDISTATGLVLKTDQDRDGVFETTWATSDYQLEPLNADADGGAYAWTEVRATTGSQRFPCGHRRPTVQVTAKFGWSDVPDDVNEAAILKAVSLFRRKDAPFGVAGFGGFGAVRIRHDPDVQALLAPYMPVLVG